MAVELITATFRKRRSPNDAFTILGVAVLMAQWIG
jgi:hypothetical protein